MSGRTSAALIAIGQAAWALWGDISLTGGTSAPMTCTASYSGTIEGCNSSALAGVLVTITNHATSAVLGTATSDGSGNFGGSITIPMAGLNVDVTASGCAPYNVNMTCGGNALGTFAPGPGSGFVCATGCINPIPTTLTVTDSLYGTFAATYASGGSPGATFWTGSATVNYPGASGCSAVTGITIFYHLECTSAGAWVSSVDYSGNGSTSCPQTTGAGLVVTHTTVSSACPPSFGVSAKNPAAQPLYLRAAAGTYTIDWS